MRPRRILTLSLGALLIFLIYQPAVYYTVWWGVIVVVGDLFDLRFPPRPESASDERADDAQSKGYPNAVDAPWVNAIERRDIDEIKRLVTSGADLEQPLFNGKTPALYAAGSDGWPIVLLLLQHGANPSATDLRGFNLATLEDLALDRRKLQRSRACRGEGDPAGKGPDDEWPFAQP